MKLLNVFTDPAAAIFGALYTLYGETYEWLEFHTVLDTDYLLTHSGDKEISPLVKRYIEANSPATTLTAEQISTIAQIVILRFGEKWKRYWEIVKSEYNPLHNYSMEELETPDIDRTHTPSDDYKIKDKTTHQTDMTEQVSGNSNTSLYGYNSPVSVPSDAETNTQTTHTTGDSLTNVDIDEHTEQGSYTDHEGGTRRLERKGNIGVTTSQQMLNSEITLWDRFTFAECLYRDIDSIMTIPIY